MPRRKSQRPCHSAPPCTDGSWLGSASDRMQRVLHITRDFPPRHCGGISTAVGALARAQVAAGLGVGVVSFDGWRPRAADVADRSAGVEMRDGATVLRVAHAAQLDAARHFAHVQRPSLLHVHHGMLWEFAAALRSQLGVAAVKTVHVVQRRINQLRGTRERTQSLAGQEAALAGADRVIVPSRAAAAALLDQADSLPGGVDRPDSAAALAARMRVVGHGIADSDPARAAAARHRAMPAAGPLLAAGRFADVKGTPELFEVMRAVLARVPTTLFVVAGGIPANRRAEARWRQRWCEAASASEQRRVRWTGWLEPDALAACYAEAAALIVPSRHETFGLVALEAMLHGLPVVATAAGGLAELIVHGETGLLSATGDTAALAEHAVALIGDPALARRLSENAAAAARDTHSWQQVLPRLLEVYAEVC